MEIVVDQGHLEFDRVLSPRSHRSLKIDLRNAQNFNLYGLTGMAVAALSATAQGHEIAFEPPGHAPGASAFLSRLGLDELLADYCGTQCNLPVISPRKESDVLVPLRMFESSSDLQPLIDLVSEQLDGVAGPQAMNVLIEALWELGANVTEHSGALGVMGAVVQRAGRGQAHLSFTVGDAGIGIRESFLRGKSGHSPASDYEAIVLALQYLVSSVDDPGRGQGLTATVEQATGLRGKVLVRTGDARRTITTEPGKGPLVVHNAAASVPRLTGTIIAVTIPSR